MIMTLLPKIVIALLFTTLTAVAYGEEPSKPVVADYISLEPTFVTHLGAPGSKLAYLKATVSLRSDANSTRPAIDAHMPRIRHELVLLFGEQNNVDALARPDFRQTLASEAKTRINQALENQHAGAAISGVLFTEFFVQK